MNVLSIGILLCTLLRHFCSVSYHTLLTRQGGFSVWHFILRQLVFLMHSTLSCTSTHRRFSFYQCILIMNRFITYPRNLLCLSRLLGMLPGKISCVAYKIMAVTHVPETFKCKLQVMLLKDCEWEDNHSEQNLYHVIFL